MLRLHRRLHPDARRRRRVHRARHLPRPAPLQAVLLPPGCTAPLHRPQRPCSLPQPPGDHRVAEPERPGGHLLQHPGRVHDVPRGADHGAGDAAADLPGAQGRVGVVAGDVGGVGAGGAVPGGGHEAGHRRGVRAAAREGGRQRQVEGRQLDLRRVPPLRQLPRAARSQRQRRRRRLRHERHGGRRRRPGQRDRLAQVRAGGGLHRRRVTRVDAVRSRVSVCTYASSSLGFVRTAPFRTTGGAASALICRSNPVAM